MFPWNRSGIGFFWFWGHRRLWFQSWKKWVWTPFAVRNCSVNASLFRTIFFMWACRTLQWFCACVLLYFFNHYKPHLIVTHVNNWSGSLLNGSQPSFFCSVNETSELVAFSNTPPPTHSECYPDCHMFHIKVSFKSLEKVKHFYLSKCIQIKAILIFVMKPGTSSWEPQRSQN